MESTGLSKQKNNSLIRVIRFKDEEISRMAWNDSMNEGV
jgi:hypothetical protein